MKNTNHKEKSGSGKENASKMSSTERKFRTGEILKKIFTPQNIGMVLAVIACVIFWLPIYKYQEVHGFWFMKKVEEKTLDLKPGLISGIIAIILNLILYGRGLVHYKNKWVGLASFLINLTLLATMIEIFVSPSSTSATTNPFLNNIFALVAAAVCLAILIFGVKEIAKFVLIIFFIGVSYMNLKLVNDAMGFLGYVNLVLVLVSAILQENIDLRNMADEFKYLFGGAKKQVAVTEDEVNKIIDARLKNHLNELENELEFSERLEYPAEEVHIM